MVVATNIWADNIMKINNNKSQVIIYLAFLYPKNM